MINIEAIRNLTTGERLSNTSAEEFIKIITNDKDCPIVFESNVNCFIDELETYRFDSKETNTIIEKQIVPIHGEIIYGTKLVNHYGNFIETRELPQAVGAQCVVYIEESKTTYKSNVIKKIIIDRKVLIFTDYKQRRSSATQCYVG